ncbi:hypothetical protein BCR34DRAFT_592057 [Clohesyomyces aquaticus]|uniref:Uncharacterized protein n=1 Tax=Clohesyomyces aquaticus TaxID=1231657 RepID=A0A1Y1YVB8_9PLEO|nr:hypothetical protein BCR34DRAFT_592057 [Clohesyomyces aquaticus]
MEAKGTALETMKKTKKETTTNASPSKVLRTMTGGSSNVKIGEDGLLDLSETPWSVVRIAQRNSTLSPLLRLPAEIRSRVWQYCFDGTIIEVRNSYDIKDPRTKIDRSVCRSKCEIIPVDRGRKALARGKAVEFHNYRTVRVPFALCVIRASRQLYAETRYLLYSRCRLHFIGDFTFQAWILEREKGQTEVVTECYYDKPLLEFVLLPLQHHRVFTPPKALEDTKILPGLKRIFTSERWLENLKWHTKYENSTIQEIKDGFVEYMSKDLKRELEVIFTEDETTPDL